MVKSRLWVAGDSYGLFDKDDSKPNWIRLVADQLGLDEIKNYSRGGADNDMIHYVANAIIKNYHWPGRNEIPFAKDDVMIYLSTTNTRGWFRNELYDQREFDDMNSIANFNWWMSESNGKLINEYDQFPKPVIHSQNFNSLLQQKEEHKKLVGHNKDLVNWAEEDHIKDDISRLSPETLDIIANYILLYDVDLARSLNNTRLEHFMVWAKYKKHKILFFNMDYSPDDDALQDQVFAFKHPSKFEYTIGDGVNEQPNHLTDQGHLDYYNNYLENKVDDIINTWSRQ